MAARQEIKMDTNHGEAVATPEKDPVDRDKWHITTPWGESRFHGTTAEAKKELSRIIAENHAEETTGE